MRLGGYWLRTATPFALIVAGVVAGAAQRNDPPMLFALAGAAVAATVITSAVQARRVVALVHEIGSFAEQVSAGEYGARVSAGGPAEIDALAESVNSMAARLACEGHARASFIGKVSHELRTPLTVVYGHSRVHRP
jgi:signal transduction histidine kinase